MNVSSYADKIDAFQTTVDNLGPDVPRYPGISDLFAELKAILLELRPAHGAVEAQRGNQRVAVKTRRDLAVRGGQIHRRLSALVAAHTGFANRDLRDQPGEQREPEGPPLEGTGS
jgi:hypothetical protein